ncbi:MAG: hypothetical protein QM790_03795 [Nibricoccus sp.]
MPQPPPLPQKVLARVLRVSALDGFALVIIAGGFGIISAVSKDWLGAFVSALATGAGVIELLGRRKLKREDSHGAKWLVRAQLSLMSVILLYALYQFFRYDPRPTLAEAEKAFKEAQVNAGLAPVTVAQYFGITPAQLLEMARTTARSVFALVAIATVGFQGGLAYYYHKKSPAISAALRKS